jgi:ABC-type Na+ efflux pump permease subunit
MWGRLSERWRAALDHPILRLELRRIRRKRWWPGRRFFLIYPALLGGALGCLITWALTDSPGVELLIVISSVPAVCLLSTVAGLLSFGLPWIAPALTASTIARERELGTLDLLRTTLLSGRSIVLGKLAGCGARLWPGMLALALLSPFQIIMTFTGTPLSLFALPTTGIPQEIGALQWGWLALLGVTGLLRPWGDLALYAAVGLFVSALSRSSTVAIAVSYGAIIVARAALGLGGTILAPLWLVLSASTAHLALVSMLVVPGLASLVTVLMKFAGAVLLVWAAIWRVERM